MGDMLLRYLLEETQTKKAKKKMRSICLVSWGLRHLPTYKAPGWVTMGGGGYDDVLLSWEMSMEMKLEQSKSDVVLMLQKR